MAGPNSISAGAAPTSVSPSGGDGTSAISLQESKSTEGGSGFGTTIKGVSSYILPFPAEVSIQTDFGWESLEVGILGTELIASGGDISNAIGNSLNAASLTALGAKVKSAGLDVLRDNAGVAALGAQKLALNPKKEVLFTGVDHRQFRLTWRIAPLNAAESIASYNFIKELHRAASPGLTSDSIFFTYPNTAHVIIIDNGEPVLDRQQCAIISIDCNFTPDGLWATFNNTNKPIHIELTVGFMEMQVPTKSTAAVLFGG